MYLMVCTRPDLAYVASLVSRYMSKPGKAHCKAVEWVLKYLNGTKDKGLLFDKLGSITKGIIGYVDSDSAGDLDKRRSLIGYVFMIGGNLVSWKASLQLSHCLR